MLVYLLPSYYNTDKRYPIDSSFFIEHLTYE